MIVLRTLQVVFAVVTGLGFVAMLIGFDAPAPSLAVFGMVVAGVGGCFVMVTAVIIGRKKRISGL
jgi:hypothetical protein